MLDVNDLVEGVTKVRILELPSFVSQNIGDVGIFQHNDGDDELPLKVEFEDEYWFFDPEHLEIVEMSDSIIEKEEQTHLDATHIGDTGNASLYYKSEILKKWFWWSEDYKWLECDFDYRDDEDLFPITISK